MDTAPYASEVWTEPAGLSDATYAYWNDESIESGKVWGRAGAEGIAPMERYLSDVGLVSLLEAGVERLRARGRRLAGRGADLACGTCWAAPHLFGSGDIERLYCVEYSSQRLRLAPRLLAHYGVPSDRVVLCLGSFYDLHVADRSLDFVFLSQAFHHADRPGALLAEIRRVLKPGGAVLLIGEHVMRPVPALYARHVLTATAARLLPEATQRRVLGRTLARKPLWPGPGGPLAPNAVTGDHYYRPAQYRTMFSAAGFSFEAIRGHSRAMCGFVLTAPA